VRRIRALYNLEFFEATAENPASEGPVTAESWPHCVCQSRQEARWTGLVEATAARYLSGHAAWPLASLAVPATHPESCDQHQHPEHNGVNPDQPYEGEYAHPGENREEQTEDH
jgi:hypothetical protein